MFSLRKIKKVYFQVFNGPKKGPVGTYIFLLKVSFGEAVYQKDYVRHSG